MHALTLRYGIQECEKTLRAIKFAYSKEPRDVAVKRDCPMVLEIRRDMCSTLSDLMTWCLTDTIPENLSIRVSGKHFPDNEPDYGWWLWYQVQQYTKWIQTMHPIFPSSKRECRRVLRSRLHTLHLDRVGPNAFEDVFEGMDTLALFEKVLIEGKVHDVGLIKEIVVDKGMITSLRFLGSTFDEDEGIQVTEMLEFNSLRSMEINAATVQSLSFAKALIASLYRHVQTFADGSILRDLDLDDTLSGLDPSTDSDLFQVFSHVIGLLPNLKSFGIFEPSDPCFLPFVADAIGRLKISHFKLWCEPSRGSTLQPLFDSIGVSKYLKVFSMRVRGRGHHSLSNHRARELWDLALSTTSGLLEIDIADAPIFHKDLLVLVPEDCDPAVASKRRLRRFYIVPRNSRDFSLFNYELDFDYLSCLLRLLSKHLPYLEDVGFTLKQKHRRHIQLLIRKKEDAGSELLYPMWSKVSAQMELNRVGMALHRPEVLPTVPSGLWAPVLHRAVTCEEKPSNLPWTGIYLMVRALVERSHTTNGREVPIVTCRKVSSGTKRPRNETGEGR